MEKKQKKEGGLTKSPGFRSFLAALICIGLGLVLGFIVLLIINPAGAPAGIATILLNFLLKGMFIMENFGNTLTKTAPLILCSLSVLFAYKAGMFNIGVAGQYVIGAGACLYCALGLGLPWYICLLAAVLAGGLFGAIVGMLKAYLNVNEVISSIMLNWICLYAVNSLLTPYCKVGYSDTATLSDRNPAAAIPALGIDKLLKNNKATIAIPLAIIVAVIIWILLEKTKFGFEIKATGFNKNAAKYCGMREKRNIILTMVIAGALGGLAASLFFQTDYQPWDVNAAAIPGMGFNGIAGAFLGGLNPIGAIFSSFFIQNITDGGTSLDTRIYPVQVSDLISAVIIYLCGFVLYIKTLMNKRTKKEPKIPDAPVIIPEQKKGGKV